ncbi:hypothetical protein GEV33_005422 [Tenebrio molitor]|uniref:Uncharacterized protein n=1 Tax=Tenebrio molitor TaxID=7067 RepID=A0A8J6HMJ0_TENMO|nr:hypothetical protein GEV33_005422 [Tenebrio molitor]
MVEQRRCQRTKNYDDDINELKDVTKKLKDAILGQQVEMESLKMEIKKDRASQKNLMLEKILAEKKFDAISRKSESIIQTISSVVGQNSVVLVFELRVQHVGPSRAPPTVPRSRSGRKRPRVARRLQCDIAPAPETVCSNNQNGFSDCFDEPNMEIQIDTLMGTSFDMRVSSTDTIREIKQRIQRVEDQFMHPEIATNGEHAFQTPFCSSPVDNGPV